MEGKEIGEKKKGRRKEAVCPACSMTDVGPVSFVHGKHEKGEIGEEREEGKRRTTTTVGNILGRFRRRPFYSPTRLSEGEEKKKNKAKKRERYQREEGGKEGFAEIFHYRPSIHFWGMRGGKAEKGKVG